MTPRRLSLALTLALAAGLSAGTAEDALVGEDDRNLPTPVPTPMGDERGTIMVTRTAQAASSFDLPAFVVTGTGERQALARRQDLGLGLDTSGGFKTSPGEKGAGKDQLEAQPGREGLDEGPVENRPFVAGLRLSGGWQPGYAGAGYIAQELGPWHWALDGAVSGSQGGPLRGPMRDPALSDQGGLKARAGWRGAGGGAFSAFGRADYAGRAPQPWVPGQEGRLSRQGLETGMDGEANLAGFELRGRLRGHRHSARVPGMDLEEGALGLDLDLGRHLGSAEAGAWVELSLAGSLAGLEAPGLAGLRSERNLGRAALLSRFQAWSGTRLGVGVALDHAGGSHQVLQLGPVLRLDQRLGHGASLQARVDSGLRLSGLRPVQGGAGEPWQAPDPRLKPAKLALDASVDLQGQLSAGFSLGLGAFAEQGEDWFLPSSQASSVLAVDTVVGAWRLQGLRARQGWRGGPWWQSAEAKVQRAEAGGGTLSPAYTPAWTAALAAGWAQGPWQARLGLDLTDSRLASVDGGLSLEPGADLSALLRYDVDAAWSVWAEGRNLASRAAEPAPHYPQAAPYAGLGLELRF